MSTTTDLTFKKEEPTEKPKLENQDGYLQDFTWDHVLDYLEKVFDDYNQFITLTLPKASHDIRFMQACQAPDGMFTIELGIEKEEGLKLVEKKASREQCVAIFQKFYEQGIVEEVETYTPVEFML